MGKIFTLSQEIIASDNFRQLSTDAQSMYIQCCAFADESGIIKDFQLISDYYLFRCEKNISKELTDNKYITLDGVLPIIPNKYKVAHWDKHRGRW